MRQKFGKKRFIRLDQNNYAIDNLKGLLEEKNLSKEERYLLTHI